MTLLAEFKRASFYRAMLSRVQYCCSKSFICLSVTLRYHSHIGSNSLKMILYQISPGCSLYADPNITDRLKREHPKFSVGIGVV